MDKHEAKAREIAACTCEDRHVLAPDTHWANCATEMVLDIAHALREAERAGMERAAEIAGAWLRSGELELHAGEMTAGEKRTVKAVMAAIVSVIRAEKEKP